MKKEPLCIKEIPSILWGDSADRVYLYVHGQGGNKNEAAGFADLALRHGYQVLSMDLPEHGERRGKPPFFEPWNAVPELAHMMSYCRQCWKDVYLFANSIGAWFSMLAFAEEPLRGCLFVSPVVDMAALISDMMTWAGVSEAQLQQEKQIPTDFGQTLSWDYWLYAREHPIRVWEAPTKILYGEGDHLIGRAAVEAFSERFKCELTVMKDGEHWFHTERQMEFLLNWAHTYFAQ